MKWEPVAAMIVLLLLGVWAVYGPSLKNDLRPGASTGRFTLPGVKGEIEMVPGSGTPGQGEATFRFLPAGGSPSRIISETELRSLLGDAAYARVAGTTGNVALRMLGVSGWGNLVWVAVGFAGQGLFFGRMFVQWVQSERKRQSHVPESFWWFSLAGGVMLFTYFAWRQDLVGVLGQTSGVVIYARNLRLIHKQRRRHGRGSESANDGSDPAGMTGTG